jgi:hypothetical protein
MPDRPPGQLTGATAWPQGSRASFQSDCAAPWGQVTVRTAQSTVKAETSYPPSRACQFTVGRTGKFDAGIPTDQQHVSVHIASVDQVRTEFLLLAAGREAALREVLGVMAARGITGVSC